MFEPKYQITDKIVRNIKEISLIVAELNGQRFSRVVLLDMERSAREISAYSSTSIEGNPLPLTDVKKLLKNAPAHIRDTEREVLNYNIALMELNQLASGGATKLDERLLLHIQKMVTDKLLPDFSSGAIRQEPVFVNDPISRQTIFFPPDHQDVPRLTTDLFSFVQTKVQTMDPIILAGIFHKQCVLIHPFIDGNGRTTRLATKVLLAGLGLNTFNLFSFERYYNNHVSKYFAAVGERGNYYDLDIDFTSWLEYFSDGILDELSRVKKELEKTVTSPGSGIKDHHRKLLDYLREHNSINDSTYATLVDRATATRKNDFRFLLDQGMIERQGKGRATYYTIKQ